MTLRRNTSIAALAFLALACAMLSSSTPWAAEPALTIAAGPGEVQVQAMPIRLRATPPIRLLRRRPASDQASRKEASQERMPARQERRRPQRRKRRHPRPSPPRRRKSPPRARKSRPLPPNLTRLKAKGEEDQAAPAKEEDKDKEAVAPAEGDEAQAGVRPRPRRSRRVTFRSPPTRWPRRHLRRSSRTAHAAIRPARP